MSPSPDDVGAVSEVMVTPHGVTMAAEIDSLKVNMVQLEHRVRYLEKLIDTKNSHPLKRMWWRIDGFPPWYRVGTRSWRPWH